MILSFPAYMGKEPYIFISYSHKDENAVRKRPSKNQLRILFFLPLRSPRYQLILPEISVQPAMLLRRTAALHPGRIRPRSGRNRRRKNNRAPKRTRTAYLSYADTNVTVEDAKKISSLKQLDSLSFTECSFDEGPLLPHWMESLRSRA